MTGFFPKIKVDIFFSNFVFLHVPEVDFYTCSKEKLSYSTRSFASSASENNQYPVKTLQGSVLHRNRDYFGVKKLSLKYQQE